MKIFIMTIFLAAASAGPVPKAFGIGGMRVGQTHYVPYPGFFADVNNPVQPQQQLVPLPGDFIVEQLPVSNFGGPVSNFGGAVAMNGGRNGEQQGIQLMLTVPSAVPPGTSVSVTVNVNSEANGGTVVSVSNPVISTPAAASRPPVTPQQAEAIIVDANGTIKEPPTAGLLPDEFDQREPPMMFLPPFENSKDSPVLVAMQGEAQQQQLAALLKTKTI